MKESKNGRKAGDEGCVEGSEEHRAPRLERISDIMLRVFHLVVLGINEVRDLTDGDERVRLDSMGSVSALIGSDQPESRSVSTGPEDLSHGS